MQQLLQVSSSATNPSATSGSTSPAAIDGGVSAGDESQNLSFDQLFENSLKDGEVSRLSIGLSQNGAGFNNLSISQIDTLRQQIAGVKGLDLAGLGLDEGMKLPNLEELIDKLGLLLEDSVASGKLGDENGSQLDAVLQELSEFAGLDEIEASIAALGAGPVVDPGMSKPVASSGGRADPGGVLSGSFEQSSPNSEGSRLAMGGMMSQNGELGGQSASNQGGNSQNGSGYNFANASMEIAASGKSEVSEKLVDIDFAMSDKARADGGRSSFADVQSKLVNGAERLYSTTVPSNVFEPEWGDELSQKIVWMTSREIQSAEIHLNPAELGPIEVKVSVQNENATVNINAQNASVRELLESQVTRLREMMEQNGLGLDDVNVGAGQQDQLADQNSYSDSDGSSRESDNTSIDALDESDEIISTASSNLVDFYA